MAVDREALERAATLCGVELEYTDTWGQVHRAPDETLRAILESFGIDPAHQRPPETPRLFAATLVLLEDQKYLKLESPVPGNGTVKLELEWETGELEHHWFWLPELRSQQIPLPALRLGYHHVRLFAVSQPGLELLQEARLIVCPRRARSIDQRVAGVALSLYALRSARNWGIGDFTDLHEVTTVFAQAGAAFIALNPLHALANRQPYNISPYLPECSLYRNFLYLDVERVPGFAPSDADRKSIDALRASEYVEYERVAAIKLAALRTAFTRFQVSGGSHEFDEFVVKEGELLEDYATYSALWAHIHALQPDVWLWTDWPREYREPRSPEVRRFALEHDFEVLFYKFLQWQVDRQLCEAQDHALACQMKIGLYHDLALATDRYGADLWTNRPFFATGARVGAPPDELAPSGQDWGFPPPNRDAHRANGYQLFVQSIRKNARHGGALRIDHVMRFFRLFWIPDAGTAAEGAYVRDYAEDLLRILALESVRAGFIVIGEDLGTVAPEVRQRLDDARILGYRVLWFERDQTGRLKAPYEYPAHAAVSTTTHDLPTLAGFFAGRDIEARKAAGLVTEEQYQRQWTSRRAEMQQAEEAFAAAGYPYDAVGFALSTPCTVAIVNQEDLTGETEQQNLPATTWEYPNWRRKMRVAVEDLAPVAELLRTKLEKAGRGHGISDRNG
ncbi:MAG: 4-alpha-glucanotransferase [Acidobacteriota bacterium]